MDINKQIIGVLFKALHFRYQNLKYIIFTKSFISGVIDDRGKFIYISKQELEGVAKFIRQRGRVSIAELAESSNTLITLTPETSCAS